MTDKERNKELEDAHEALDEVVRLNQEMGLYDDQDENEIGFFDYIFMFTMVGLVIMIVAILVIPLMK